MGCFLIVMGLGFLRISSPSWNSICRGESYLYGAIHLDPSGYFSRSCHLSPLDTIMRFFSYHRALPFSALEVFALFLLPRGDRASWMLTAGSRHWWIQVKPLRRLCGLSTYSLLVAVLEDSLLGGGSCLQGRYKGGDIIAPLYFSILLSCSSPEVSVSDNSP